MARKTGSRGVFSPRFVQILVRGASIAMLAAGLSGCASSVEQEPLEVATGRGAGTTHDGLVRMQGSALEGVWVKPDIDITEYDRLLVGPVRMSYKRPPSRSRSGSNFPLNDSQTQQLEQTLVDALEKEISSSKSWSLAEEPAPDVLLIEPFLLDLIVRVPPGTTSGRDRTFTTSAGEVTLVLEVRDSQSDEILARVADRREARNPGTGSQQLSWSNPVNNAAAVRSLFRDWARIFVARLDTAARLSTKPESAGGGAGHEAGD